MPRQRGGSKLIYGTLGFLLFAGVVVVIVLAALGYFNKKSGSSGGSSPVTPTTTCMPPNVTNVSFGKSNGPQLVVQFNPPITHECIPSFNGLQYDIQIYENTGHLIENRNSAYNVEVGASSIPIPITVPIVKGANYTGTVKIGYGGQTGNLMSPEYKFSFVA